MASHVMGGDLTWSCDGSGNYVFELVFYRDCNGAEVNIIAEQLRVWNHPTLTTIHMPLFLEKIFRQVVRQLLVLHPCYCVEQAVRR